LSKSKVRVFFEAATPKCWEAGFIINSTPEFRYFETLEESIKLAKLAEHGITEDNMCEVTCIWMNSSTLKVSQRMYVYFWTMIDGVLAGKDYLFGGSTEPKVIALQRQVMPRPFIDDEVEINGYRTNRSLYYTKRWEGVLIMLGFIGRRLLGLNGQKSKTKQGTRSGSANEKKLVVR
jgi:hypothetical protein